MAEPPIAFVPVGRRGMRVTLRTDGGWELTAQGAIDESVPELTGEQRLRDNRVVEINLWAYACAEKGRRLTRDRRLRKELGERAATHAELTKNVAALVERVGTEARESWCSGCFELSEHRKVEARFAVPTYLCGECGAATLSCAAPRCRNMATRGFGPLRIPRFCAEHRHDLPSFERGKSTIGDLADFDSLLRYDRRNLAKTTKVAGTALVAAGAMTGVGIAAAPLIGGVIGTTVGGFSGAAASSYGLALLGGGSLAAGGFGVAGGTAVVAAAGAGLGGVIGARLTSAYVSEDRSFGIEKLRGGPGMPVVVCSGFLTESRRGWGDWERIVTERYPDSSVYRVHWGAEELKDLGTALGGIGTKFIVGAGLKKLALGASKQAAKKAGPIGGALIVVDLVKNPWWRARERANKTGAIVADLLARTEIDEVVLVGHSLGARAMVHAAEVLATKGDAPSIREVHLLGAALSASREWGDLDRAVSRFAYNYHSRDDAVLKFFYSIMQAGRPAAGYAGMDTRLKQIKNVDVTKQVPDHFTYCKSLSLA